MARNYRYSISLSDEQNKATQALMKLYLQPDVASLFNILMVDAYRETQKKRNKDERPADDAQLAIYPHPDQLMNKNRLLTKDELNDWYLAKGQKMPDML
ncbi:MAG: hypothetical protein ACYDAK_13250 [Candidatus Limnocylindrales bacterium]